MNKRQKKKYDKKLYHAILELNKMLAEDLEVEYTEDGILEAFKHVKSNPKYVSLTLEDYDRMIVKGGKL